MTSQHIYEKAQRLLNRTETRNPVKIAKELGINVMYRDDFTKLKGVYKIVLGHHYFFINRNLDEFEQRVVLAHELGHFALHQKILSSALLLEIMLYDVKNRVEYEANAFAAEILIDDDEVIELIEDGLDESGIASTLGVSVDLLLIKVGEMNRRGYELTMSRVGCGDFLRG